MQPGSQIYVSIDRYVLAIIMFKLKRKNKLQPWPDLLGHKGNKPIKMTYFLLPPPPMQC